MPSTYSQIYVHLIFAVMFKNSLLHPRLNHSLFGYMKAIIKNYNQELLAINGSNDHVHLLLKLRPDMNLSDLVRDLKSYSTKWINISGLNKERFRWQTGYGAFSVSHCEMEEVKRYIHQEERRHKQERFLNEYKRLLKDHEVAYEDAWIFREPE
jgi:putative transposase